MSGESPALEPVVHEPLEESAPIQWRIAQECCTPECLWYHGPRLYLRALGVQIAIRHDSGFLVDACAQVAREQPTTRALISGAADYGMLAHLAAACFGVGRSLEVTVVDRCPTPLHMNAWLAARMGVSIATHHGDIMEFATDRTFDLVCTHSFFGRFDVAGRRALLERWHALLKPGGAVVTANPLRPSAPDTAASVDADEARGIRDRADRARERALSVAGVDPGVVSAWADEFVRRKTGFPVHSTDEIRALFDEAGFSPVFLSTYGSRPSEPAAADARHAPRLLRFGLLAYRRL